MPPVNTKSVMEKKGISHPPAWRGAKKKSDHKRGKLRDTVFKSPFDKHLKRCLVFIKLSVPARSNMALVPLVTVRGLILISKPVASPSLSHFLKAWSLPAILSEDGRKKIVFSFFLFFPG